MIDTSHLHPMLVHFPIALAMVGLVFEIVSRILVKDQTKASTCGEIILYLATVSAGAALLSGVLFTNEMAGKANEIRELHRLLASLSTLFLFLTSVVYLINRYSLQKRKGLQNTGILLYVVSAICIGATGFFGGDLVYSYMIGL